MDEMNDIGKVNKVKADFKTSTRVLTAIGDETRQSIILALHTAGCDGLRVGEITIQTHLSRPAVSHHLKILKDAGIVKVYKEATKNFYYLDPTGWLFTLKDLIFHMEELLQ